MKLSSVRYLTGEGIKNTWVNRLMTLASIGVLVACMVIIGLAFLISENINVAIGNLEEQNVVMVYMKDYNWVLYGDEAEHGGKNPATGTVSGSETTDKDVDENGISKDDYIIHNEEEAKELCAEIEKLSNVESAVYVSSEKGLESVENILKGQEKYFTFLYEEEYGNPMSCAAKVTMKDMALFDETIKEIEKLEGVSTIQSQADLAKIINSIKDGMAVAGFWIIAILIIISLVIVSNTIRVTMYNRKLEISIMKAVGATDAFVRIPFIVEGVIIGLVSAVISEVVLYFCYRIATETIIGSLNAGDIVKYGDMALILFLIFVAIGVLAGVIGSVIMIGKYLKREGSEFAAI